MFKFKLSNENNVFVVKVIWRISVAVKINNELFLAFQGLVKEFELTVVLTKSRSGSFGFTITRSKLDNCYYIQEILDNPAKADGRLRAGDRLITVRTNTHMNTHVRIFLRIYKQCCCELLVLTLCW